MSKINTNEILYRIKKALNLSNEEMLKAYGFEDYEMDSEHLNSLLIRRQDDGFKICSYEELGVFLDGLVSLKRGVTPRKDEEEVELTNNLILKKLRIALELKDSDMMAIFGELTKQQLASLFRNENHKNYKECSDESLLRFLDGLESVSLAKS